MSKQPSNIFAGFSTLAVSYGSSQHIIYLRPQTGASTGSSAAVWPEGRTLFMVNIPPDSTDREVALLFRSCGTLERVVFDSDTGWGLGDEEASGGEEDGDEEDGDHVGGDEGNGGDGTDDEEKPRKKKRRLAQDSEDTRPRPPKVDSLPSRPLRRLHRTGHTVHVIFLDSSSCVRALALATPPASASKTSAPTPRLWATDTAVPAGLAHYAAIYDFLRPPLDIVLAHANSSIELFDFEQAEKKRALQRESKYRKGEAIVDEDGFTLVTRGGAYGKAIGGGVGVTTKKFMLKHSKGNRAAPLGSGRKRKYTDSKEKDAFYAFQIHEKKRNGALSAFTFTAVKFTSFALLLALMDLKRKWEEDKAAVEKLKASRKFKPY
jgi:ribosomal RNA-processing protein 7